MSTEQLQRRPWHELKVLRLCANLSHAALADRVGVHYTQISSWERGQRRARETRYAQLAAALGVPVDVLQPGAVKEPSFKETAAKLAAESFAAMGNGYADKLIGDATEAAA
jgi:transcriptional regulator with XRE-family HTH domain